MSSLKKALIKKVVARSSSSSVVVEFFVQHRNMFTLKQKEQDEKKACYNLPQLGGQQEQDEKKANCNLPQAGGLNVKQYFQPLRCEFCHNQSSYVLFYVLRTQVDSAMFSSS